MNTATSPKVQYAYSEMPSGADHSRLTSITYPSGYVLTYNYSSGINDSISRLSSLSDTTGTLEGYSYLGLGTVVIRSHPQPGIDLTYVKQSGESNGDAGDEYTGLDRFGRVVDQRWIKTSSGTATDRFQYTYDRDGNRLTRDDLVNSSFDETYTYDGLNQLAAFARGTHTQGFDYDAVGNFDGVTTDGTTQTRTANAQNEITGISGLTTPVYDANGNMTTDQSGKQFVYDAWNRVVAVKDSGGTTLETFGYDGLNRRVTNTVGSATTDLFYSSQWQVLEEKQGSNTTARYAWSPVYVDALVLRDRDTDANGTLDERLWVQQDANWNVTSIMDGSGVVQERYVYDPYGSQTVYSSDYSTLRGSSSYGWTQGFQGMFFDPISGTYHSRGRTDYSPTLGRWDAVDPERFGAGDVDLYGFVGNNPVASTDPSGLLSIKVIAPMKREYESTGPGVFGVFAWPADFKLSEPAPCDGQVVQHLRVTLTLNPGGGAPAGKPFPIADYWEFWDINKEETSPSVKYQIGEGELNRLGSRGFKKESAELTAAHNDWFGFGGADVRNAKGVFESGAIDYKGEVWFAEGQPPDDQQTLPGQYYSPLKGGPAQWIIPSVVSSIPEPISLILPVYHNDSFMRDWISKHAKAGPVPHTYHAEWTTTGRMAKASRRQPS